MIKISVIIPIYNKEEYLKECLDSVLCQTFQDMELICVDDGSTDSSSAILKEYVERDNRVLILCQQNQGAGAARNYGLAEAKGKYVIFLDADDIFEVSLLDKLYTAIETSHSDVAVCRSDKYNQKTKKYTAYPWSIRKNLMPDEMPFSGTDVKKDFFKLFIWWPWDKLYRKSFIDRLGIRFQDLRTTNDLFFVAGSVLKAQRIFCIEDVLVHHRVGMEKSLSVTREESWGCFYKALLVLRDYMKKENLYERFEQDFINYCLHFSLWNLETLRGSSYCLLYNALRNNWFKELRLTDKTEDYFYNKNDYAIMRHILNTSLENHLSETIGALESELRRHGNPKALKGSSSVFCHSGLANAFMRVKLYYKGYGFVNTVKKIMEKLTE